MALSKSLIILGQIYFLNLIQSRLHSILFYIKLTIKQKYNTKILNGQPSGFIPAANDFISHGLSQSIPLGPSYAIVKIEYSDLLEFNRTTIMSTWNVEDFLLFYLQIDKVEVLLELHSFHQTCVQPRVLYHLNLKIEIKNPEIERRRN